MCTARSKHLQPNHSCGHPLVSSHLWELLAETFWLNWALVTRAPQCDPRGRDSSWDTTRFCFSGQHLAKPGMCRLKRRGWWSPRGPHGMDPRGAEMMKAMAAAEPETEFLDLGLGPLRALIPTHWAPRAPHKSHQVCGRMQLPKIKHSISLLMGGNGGFSSLLYSAAFWSLLATAQ